MNTRTLPLLIAATCLFFAGCLPKSVNPLSSPAASRIDERFEGVYRQIEENKNSQAEPGYWHFHYCGASAGPGGVARRTTTLEVFAIGHQAKAGFETTRYRALATKIAGRDYLSFVAVPNDGSNKGRPNYSFARYAINWRGDLCIWLASESAFVSAVKGGQLRGQVTSSKFSDSVRLTDTTEHLAAFIAAGDPDKLFSDKPMVLRRIAR